MKKRLILGTCLLLAMTTSACKQNNAEEAVDGTEQTVLAMDAETTETTEATDTEDLAFSEENNQTDEQETETSEEVTIGTTLEDGEYYTNLMKEPSPYLEEYIKSFRMEGNVIYLEASISRIESWTPYESTDFPMDGYTILVDDTTNYLAGGGEAEPDQMTQEEFLDYISGLMNSGLGLEIEIENGVATEVGIWS